MCTDSGEVKSFKEQLEIHDVPLELVPDSDSFLLGTWRNEAKQARNDLSSRG